jgi:methyl-accepting chemotaxis protein
MSELITHEGVTYRKVNRDAEVGEKVLTVKYQGSNTRPGEVLTVTEANYLDGSIQTDKRAFFDTEYDKYVVLEPIAEEETVSQPLTQSVDLFVTEADVRNNPRQVIDLIANLALRVTTLEQVAGRLSKAEKTIESITRDLGWNEMGPGRIANLRNSVSELKDVTKRMDDRLDEMSERTEELDGDYSKLLGKVDRLASASEQAISTVARNVETWAQEVELTKEAHEELKRKVAVVDERTQPYQQAHELFVKIAGGLNARQLTVEERREL